jgi:hypothetical protein
VPNFADVDSAESMRIAAGVLDQLAVARDTVSDVPKDPGGPLEQAVCDDLGWVLQRKDPNRGWRIERGAVITRFDQYAHLSEVDALVRANPQLRVTVGTDYLIRPDVTVSLARVRTASGLPVLHAAVSCKWTIRLTGAEHPARMLADDPPSPGPQRPPGATAEPLPTRLASIARGTGEVDAVYHIAYDAMAASVAGLANSEQADAWHEVTGQRRVLSYELLVDTLASW